MQALGAAVCCIRSMGKEVAALVVVRQASPNAKSINFHMILHSPGFVAPAVVWLCCCFPQAPLDSIKGTVNALGPVVDLAQVYGGLHAPAPYNLRWVRSTGNTHACGSVEQHQQPLPGFAQQSLNPYRQLHLEPGRMRWAAMAGC